MSERQIGCYKVATAKSIKMHSRRKYIVERKVKEVGCLEKEQCPVYRKQLKEKCRFSCSRCNKDFKKAAYLRRHMQKLHVYKITSLKQVTESTTQESDMDDCKENQSVRDEQDPEEVRKNLQKEISESR